LIKLLIILLSLFQILFSQTFSDFSFVGARSIGSAGSIVSNPNSSECSFYNPAGLVMTENYSLHLGKTSLYGIDFLEHNFISINIPVKNTGITLSMQELSTSYSYNDNDDLGNENWESFDGDLSKEKQFSFSQGIKLLNDQNSTLSIGYNINYYLTFQSASAGPQGDGVGGISKGKSYALGLDFGLYSSLREKISFGAFVKNINSPRESKGSSNVYYPRKMDIGIGYKPFKGLYTNFSLNRLLGTDESSFRFGFEYLVTKQFTMRSGVQINSNNNRFGIGFTVNGTIFSVSYGLLTHPLLDITNVLDVKFYVK